MRTKKETHRISFTGIERLGSVINPGSTTQENGRLIIRGMVQQAQDDVTDPRLSGDLTIDVNAWFDASTFSGPMLGTFILENKNGKWLCAWIGRRTPNGGSTLEAWGVGLDQYDSLQAHWNYTRQNPDPNAAYTIKGYILQAKPDS